MADMDNRTDHSTGNKKTTIDDEDGSPLHLGDSSDRRQSNHKEAVARSCDDGRPVSLSTMVAPEIVEVEVTVGLDTDDGKTEEQWQWTSITVWRFDLGGSILPTRALWRHPTVGDLNEGGGATPEIEWVRAVG
ncbi:unnamed protein product [Lactuca saligna]|uniref:Uncharacterized protein n=1 Tax=Lactuca saligna TaxID=75948 RepID=A0AA35ZLV8_LACSI|nr:unnamed protein product [Lactuca saligna]